MSDCEHCGQEVPYKCADPHDCILGNQASELSEPKAELDRVVSFAVTGKAMRPASQNLECFYCQQPIGEAHKSDCVLVRKKVKVRMTLEYEIDVPAFWDKHQIEFHRNEGSWCADNAIEESEAIGGEDGCICSVANFMYLGGDSAPYLGE